MNTAAPLIHAQAISYRYGERAALSDVSFQVARGERFALLGPNGSGKSTLLRLLMTLTKVQEGQISVDGMSLSTASAAIRERIGVVFQGPSLDKHLSVVENLQLSASMYGLSATSAAERIDQLVANFALTEYVNARVKTLSGGFARRVELARALMHRPPLLLLDEPTSGLDPRARSDLWRQLEGLRRKEGVTIVLATHLMDEADDSDSVLLLDRGKAVAHGSPEALKSAIKGTALHFRTHDPEALQLALVERYAKRLTSEPRTLARAVRCHSEEPYEIAALAQADLTQLIQATTVEEPSLEDVFLSLTGHSLTESDPIAPMSKVRRGRRSA